MKSRKNGSWIHDNSEYNCGMSENPLKFYADTQFTPVVMKMNDSLNTQTLEMNWTMKFNEISTNDRGENNNKKAKKKVGTLWLLRGRPKTNARGR